ncbi:MAG: hypothetical protein ACTSRZ_04070 [Promethearchaeota archaeon]
MSEQEDMYEIPPDQSLEELDEAFLAEAIRVKRNLPYSLKIERIKGNIIYCRNSWGNHIVYEFKNGKFELMPIEEYD